jgi:hypothetical protein
MPLERQVDLLKEKGFSEIGYNGSNTRESTRHKFPMVRITQYTRTKSL